MPVESVDIENLRRVAAEKAHTAQLAHAEAFGAALALADAEGRLLPSPATSLLAQFDQWLAALALFRSVPDLNKVLPGEEEPVTLLDAITFTRDELAAVLGALPDDVDGTVDPHARFTPHPLLAARQALIRRVLDRDPDSSVISTGEA